MLLALLDPFCPRPPPSLGFGLPVLEELSSSVSLLTEINTFADLQKWNKLIIMYETSLNVHAFDKLVNSLRARSHEELEIIEYQLDNGHDWQLLEALKLGNGRQFVIVFGGKRIVEDLIVSLRQLFMLNFKFKWFFVMTESIAVEDLRPNVQEIISTSDISLAIKQVDRDCNLLRRQCLLQFLLDAIRRAFLAFEPELNENNSTRLPLWIKNRYLSYLKVSSFQISLPSISRICCLVIL